MGVLKSGKGKRRVVGGLAPRKFFLGYSPFRGKEMAIFDAIPSCASYISS